ncbi:MAG: 3-deoxy-8-phosphooctulonate synthase [Deltaproteobacteria bacterium]|nr:3-deoxy-8-phosphooctulonate synthase [Deltaproteobacteria bacterium]
MSIAATAQQRIGPVELGGQAPLLLIAGPCVIESLQHTLAIAHRLQQIATARGIGLVFKASYDKANRTKGDAFRGPGLDAGLRVLAEVKAATGLPVLTDVHDVSQVEPAAAVVDVLQVPAFLCRQTDLVVACARSGRPVNLKKGQFVAPRDAVHMVRKAQAAGASAVSITERGFAFGYNNLVVDMRGLAQLRQIGVPVIFDATHSVQLPGTADGASGGEREMVPVLARAAAAVGVDALYVEVHDAPERAPSDAANALTFELLEQVLEAAIAIDALVSGRRRR